MKITATHLETNTGLSASSFSTASLTLIGNQLLLVAISQSTGGAVATTPSCSLTGWTFNQIKTINFGTRTDLAITLFSAIGSGNGSIGFTFGGQTQAVAGWTVSQYANTRIDGAGGANAIVQNTFGSAATGAVGYSLTLSAFANTDNAAFSCVAKNATNNVVPGTGWTELSEATNVTTAWDIESMWDQANNTNPNATFQNSGGDAYGAIAVELAAVQANGGFLHNFLQ